MLPTSKQDYLYFFYIFSRFILLTVIIGGVFSGYVWLKFQTTLLNPKFLNYLWYLLEHNRYDTESYKLMVIAAGIWIFFAGFILYKNPHSRTLRFSRFATKSDIRRMKPSVLKKNGLCLGVLRGGKLLFTDEPLGMLCVAPAGAGKTAGTVVPTILTCDKDSLIVNDPKGELYDLTWKYRAKISNVFRIEWGQSQALHDEKTTFWNPLDLSNLPDGTAERAKYIDIITNILIKEVKGDTFWVNSGRKTLSAMFLFAIYTNELNGKSTSIAEVKDMLAVIGVKNTSEDDEDMYGSNKDASQEGFKLKAEEVSMLNIPEVIKNRCYTVFSELASTSPNTLGSILATISSDLAIFNNENVRQITSKNTFSMKLLRGTAEKPTTIYLISPAAEQDLFGVLSGIFVEMAYRYITSEPIATLKTANIVRFILDEVAFFPKISAVIDGPAIARGYKGSFLFVCQDLSQISDKYGAGALDTMFTNTAFKIVLPQNNDNTAKRLAGLGGKVQQVEWAGNGKTRNKKTTIVNLLEASDILSMTQGKQIVFVQNNAKTPIFCNIPFYFKNRRLKAKVSSN